MVWLETRCGKYSKVVCSPDVLNMVWSDKYFQQGPLLLNQMRNKLPVIIPSRYYSMLYVSLSLGSLCSVLIFEQGYARRPYEWSPRIVDIQIFRIGQLVILILPGEFTTMSGRRLKWADELVALTWHLIFLTCREAVRRKLIADGITGEDAYVIAVGPGNTYSHVSTASSPRKHCRIW